MKSKKIGIVIGLALLLILGIFLIAGMEGDTVVKSDFRVHTAEEIKEDELIIRETANYYNLSPEDLKGVSRSREKTLGRQIAMYLMRQLTNLSLNDIGKELGRNHTTALSSIRRIEELMASDQAITIVIRDITSNITSSTG